MSTEPTLSQHLPEDYFERMTRFSFCFDLEKMAPEIQRHPVFSKALDFYTGMEAHEVLTSGAVHSDRFSLREETILLINALYQALEDTEVYTHNPIGHFTVNNVFFVRQQGALIEECLGILRFVPFLDEKYIDIIFDDFEAFKKAYSNWVPAFKEKYMNEREEDEWGWW